jgi:nicotinate-nucleotide--dimethylbenzimidazole phosphoribosyltransferase
VSFILPTIAPLRDGALESAQRRLDALTKPLGALGALEPLAAQLCAIQGTLTPGIERPLALLFAADHGLAREGVSAYPREVTAQMLANFASGGAAINVLARLHGCGLCVVDAGVDAGVDAAVATVADTHEDAARTSAALRRASMGRGTGNVLIEPAMTRARCEAALHAGMQIAREQLARGVDAMLLGEMGIGNTAIAALLLQGMTGWPLADCVGRGTGLDDAGLARKHATLRRVLQARGPAPSDIVDLLADRGGFEFAMLVGAALAAGEAGRVVLVVDGFATTVAVALAIRLRPELQSRCVFAHESAEHAHAALLRELNVRPLLRLGMRLGEGTGAVLALPLLRAACALIGGMATMQGAGISDRDAPVAVPR